jgi:hypothetical protein
LFPFYYSRYYSGQLGDLGSGAGKGGGGGGSIREAGGAFGKLEAGREEEYFYKQVSTVFKNSLFLILIAYDISYPCIYLWLEKFKNFIPNTSCG